MSLDRARSLLALALAVVAFGALAATLDSGELPTGNSTGGSPPTDAPSGPNGSIGGGGFDFSMSAPTRACPQVLADPATFAAFAGIVLVAGLALYRWRGSTVLSVVVAGPPLLGAVALCPAVVGGWLPLAGLAGIAPSSALLVVALVVALGGAVAFLYVVTDERASLDGDDGISDDAVDLGKVGEAAGDAADRIERQADVSNEVYRAWREMVRHLRVPNPEATTPDEFEERAVEAGMRADDVAELTRLFEEVRYGERDPAGREERAVTALRGIEAAYATGDGRDTGGDGVDANEGGRSAADEPDHARGDR